MLCLGRHYRDIFNEVRRYAFLPAYMDVYKIRTRVDYIESLGRASRNQLKSNLEEQLDDSWNHSNLRRKKKRD